MKNQNQAQARPPALWDLRELPLDPLRPPAWVAWVVELLPTTATGSTMQEVYHEVHEVGKAWEEDRHGVGPEAPTASQRA